VRVALFLVCVGLLVVPSASAGRLGGRLVALVTAETENELFAVSLPDGQVVRRVRLPADPENVAASGRGAVVVSSRGHAVTILGPSWHVQRVLRNFKNPHIPAIAPDGEWAYVTDDGSGIVSVVELHNARIVHRVFVGLGAHHLSFRPNESQAWVALGERARRIVVLDTHVPNRPRVATHFDPGFPAHDLAFTLDGRRVWITSDSDTRVRIFDARTHRLLSALEGGTPPQHVAFGHDGFAYVTSGYGSTIEMVDARTGRVLRRVPAPYGSFNVTTLGSMVLTSSLVSGTVTEFNFRLRRIRSVKVAPAARDVAASVWPTP
jgi:DNA-binding beta-propeller fold protein YncE